jgi:hypothetical protein
VPTSLSASRRAVAATLLGAAILGTATACATSAPSTSATSNSTATASASAQPSGNPLAAMTADQIATKAATDFKTVSSVHVTGKVADSGQVISFNLTVGRKNCKGEMGIKGEGTFSMVKIGKSLWIKPDDQFWKYAAGSSLTPAVSQILTGKYIKPTAKNSSLSPLGSFCSLSQFAASFGITTSGQANGLVKDGTTTIAGQPALRLKDTANEGFVYVTPSARTELLRLDAGRSGHLDFSGYNAPLRLTPPPASETLDGAKYGF